jgi:alpha-tubulin suppressor-like RCC1 family protein
MADAALAALRAVTCKCAATAKRFSPEQSAEAAALANILRALFSRSTAVATAELPVEPRAPLLPQLPIELIVEVLQHLDVRSLARLACTCRQLYFGPPCPPRPTPLVEAAIRRRAHAVGRWTLSLLLAGENKWVPFLLQREWQRVMAVRTVAAGWKRSFFVDADGALLACGKEKRPGLLGLQEGTGQAFFIAAVPTPVPSMAGVCVRAVACHNSCNLAVSEAGQVFAWGCQLQQSEEEGIGWTKRQPPVPTVMEELRKHRVRQAVAGEYHCAAVTEDGALFTWLILRFDSTDLDEPVSELGYGNFVHDVAVPYRVLSLEGVRIASVAVGAGFTVAVTEAEAVYLFGTGDGRLGHGEGDEEEDVFLPKRIEALDGIHVVSVAAGDLHTLALTRCGQVSSWAAYGHGRCALGHGSDGGGGGSDDLNDDDYSIPRPITALSGMRVRAIAAGWCISCAVTDAGALYTWGENTHGNLDHRVRGNQDRPTLVQGLHAIRVVGASMADKHTLVLAADGSVYAFGKGPGLGNTPQRLPNLKCMVQQ